MKVMRFRRLATLALGVVIVSASAAAQEPTVPPLRHQVSVRLVLVDLTALDKNGRFVSDLTKDDFELFEDGKRVNLRSMELVRFLRPGAAGVTAPDQARVQAPGRDNRFFVVFDSINTIKRYLDQSRTKIVEKLATLVQVGEQIMVLEMTESGSVKVLQPLTNDKTLIAKAVDQASGSIWVEKAADTLAVPRIIAQTSMETDPDGTPLGGNKFERTNRDIYELETRRRFEKTINSLLAVLNTIKDYPGKKSVLYVSGGIPSISFGGFMSGQGGPVADTTVIQTQVAAAKILDPFKQLKKQGFRSGQEILEDLFQFANSHNISFYALDPDNYLRYIVGDMAYENFPRAAYTLGGQPVPGLFREDEVAEIKKVELSKLKSLSGETGGVAFLGGNKFEEFERVLERDLAQYYELSYTPPRKEPDGRYHEIRVRLKRPGVEIRARSGYMDYSEDQRETLLFASAAYNPSLFKDIPFEARVVPFLISRDKFSFWVQTALPLRAVAGVELVEPEQPVSLKFRIIVDDLSRDQGLLSEVAMPLVLSPAFLKKNKDAERVGFSCGSQELDRSESRYRLTVALFHEGLGRVGTAEETLSVPAPAAGPASQVLNAVLGTLGQVEPSRSAAYAISGQDGALELPGYRFYPMAVHALDRKKITAVFLQVAAPNPETTFQADVLLDRNGVLVSPLSSKPVNALWNKSASLWNMVLAFALGDFAPGGYTLRVQLRDPSGSQRVETTIPITIQ